MSTMITFTRIGDAPEESALMEYDAPAWAVLSVMAPNEELSMGEILDRVKAANLGDLSFADKDQLPSVLVEALARLDGLNLVTVLAKPSAALRFAFYVDVGDMTPSMTREELTKLRERFKKNRNGMEDTIFIPVRGEPSRVDALVCPDCRSPHLETAKTMLQKLKASGSSLEALKLRLVTETDPAQRERLEHAIKVVEEAETLLERERAALLARLGAPGE